MRRYLPFAILGLSFVSTLLIRIHGIERRFLLLEDQIRDWAIALRPISGLPLVGPPTHVGGYTIGPAFYWIMWLIRVVFGPWFDNLPHAGGIGQAVLQSAADTLLLFAVWQRTRSVWIAGTLVVLLATAGFDLNLSAVIWNPVVGSILAKLATALVLLRWPEKTRVGVAVTAAIAWCAVQSYTGAIFVAIGVFAAILAAPLAQRNRPALLINALIIAAVVAVLQLPYAIHQLSTGFEQRAMGAVTGSIGQILRGEAPPQLTSSWVGFFGAFHAIEIAPWAVSWAPWVIIACGLVTVMKYRNDYTLLAVTVLPQLAAFLGYAFYVGDFLDHYYYLSLMPAALLTILLAITAIPSQRVAMAVSVAVFAVSLMIAPARIAYSRRLPEMPEYALLVDGSRTIAKVSKPMRTIQTEFALPPTADRTFMYTILGGHIDPSSPYIAVIKADGGVVFQQAKN